MGIYNTSTIYKQCITEEDVKNIISNKIELWNEINFLYNNINQRNGTFIKNNNLYLIQFNFKPINPINALMDWVDFCELPIEVNSQVSWFSFEQGPNFSYAQYLIDPNYSKKIVRFRNPSTANIIGWIVQPSTCVFIE